MDLYGQYPAGHIPVGKPYIDAKVIAPGKITKCEEFMLPCKTFYITIGLGNDGYEDEALQFPFQALIYIVGLKQAILRIADRNKPKRFP